MTKLTVDAANVREKDYFIGDDELPGFGLRVFAFGKRSYLTQLARTGRSLHRLLQLRAGATGLDDWGGQLANGSSFALLVAANAQTDAFATTATTSAGSEFVAKIIGVAV